jgi:anti-sigma factor RsiW
MTRDCPSERQWEAFVDGELAPDRMAGFTAHLAECEDCRQLVDEMINLRSLLIGLPDPVVPSTLVGNVMTAVADVAVPAPASYFRRVVLTTLLALLAVGEAAMVVIRAYGYSLGDLLALAVRTWPALGGLARQVTQFALLVVEVLTNPLAARVVADTILRTPWLWSLVLLTVLAFLILVPKVHTSQRS